VFHPRPDRVRVVHDGIDLTAWQGAAPADLSALGVVAGDRVCLTVARLHPQKAVHDLVAAAAQLGDLESVHFVVVGDGPDRAALDGAVSRARIGGRVHLLGHRDDVASLLARADLFVLPLRFEGLPSAVIEAMAAGRPVVATSVGGVPELVEQGVSGWLVPPSAPTALAAALRTALASDLAAAGAAARRRAEDRFSAPVMTARFARLYEEVAA
jgi:glycosyltransferase involved in cell wall biosynthesis